MCIDILMARTDQLYITCVHYCTNAVADLDPGRAADLKVPAVRQRPHKWFVVMFEDDHLSVCPMNYLSLDDRFRFVDETFGSVGTARRLIKLRQRLSSTRSLCDGE